MKFNIRTTIFTFLLFSIFDSVFGQSIYYFPQVDTLQVYSGCTEPFLNIIVKNDSSQTDTIAFSAGFNTGLSYTDSIGEYQYIDYYYFLINDSSINNNYKMWYNPVESWYDSLKHQVSMDTISEYYGYFYLTLYVFEDEVIIDSLTQFIHAKQWGMDIDNQTYNLSDYHLLQNYPNPFNPKTNITYQIPKSLFVKLTVYDINGRLVETLINEYQNAGHYTIGWNANKVCSGIYFYQIDTGEYTCVKKCLVVK